MKKLHPIPIKALMLVACFLFAFTAAAYDIEIDGIYYEITEYSDGRVVASVENNGDFNTYSGDVIIPATIEYNGQTCQVTNIGYQAFRNCTQLTSVSIPEGVQYMSNYAFAGCTSLTSITLPSSMYSIYNYVFQGCTALSQIFCSWETARSCSTNNFDADTYANATLNVPKGSLSSYQSTAPWSSFANIEEVTRFTVDGIYYNITGTNTVEVTYKDANFNHYTGNVTIPSSVTFAGTTYSVVGIGMYAFRQSPGLTAVTIPSSVTYIDYASFYQCEDLTEITIPRSVTQLGEFAFMYCTDLTTVTLNSGITSIPRQCFTLCEKLTSINIPSTVKEIGSFAFYQCYHLSSLSFPEGLESIFNDAMESCTSLVQVDLPSSLTYLGPSAFAGCTSLASIHVNSGNSHFTSYEDVLFDAAMDTLLVYPNMHASTYVIPDGVSIIGSHAFAGCSNLTEVTIHNGVTEIMNMAFQSCSNLQTAIIPQGLTTIGRQAFADCSNLDLAFIAADVTSIGDGAFAACTRLEKLLVDENNANYVAVDGVLYSIDRKTLAQYPSGRPDKHYSVLNGTDSIQRLAFSSSNVKSVYLPTSLRRMGDLAFSYSNIERLVIDEGLEVIPPQAFYGCQVLQSIYLPSTITKIDDGAFYYTISVRDITIACSSEVPTLGNNALYGLGYNTLANGVQNMVYVPSGMESKYSGLDDWLDYATFNTINPLESSTEFTVDSLIYVTFDANLNASVRDVISQDILDPGIPPKVAYMGNLCTVVKLTANSMQNCTKMVRAEVPFTVTWMDDYSFYGCSKIETLRFHEGLKQIDPFSLSHINQLSEFTIPASVDSISGSFVNYTSRLSKINVAEGNTKYTSIGGMLYSKDGKKIIAFAPYVRPNYTIPDGTEIIGASSFRGASSLKKISMPSSLKAIEYSAFLDCSSLTEVVVPCGVETIGNGTFNGCTGLTTVELPSTLTSLGYNAFYNTPNLATIKVRSTTPPTCKIYSDPRIGEIMTPFQDSHYNNCTLYVPRGSLAAYKAANIWKNFLNIVETDYPAEYTRGDVNDDGLVDVSDVTTIISYVLGNTTNVNTYAADVNYDGTIDVSDVTELINFILNGIWSDDIDMWYLLGGHVGSDPWSNTDPLDIGYGLIPMYPTGAFVNGKGVLTYTSYFTADEWIMLIHTPGDWFDVAGILHGQYGVGDNYAAFRPGTTAGYYTLTLNTATNEFTCEPYTASSPQTYSSMAMPGQYLGWAIDDPLAQMKPVNPLKENHEWIYRDFTISEASDVKFATDSWMSNWGTDSFPYGIGTPGGLNIPATTGTYDVYFNDITGHYNFIRK